MYLIKRKKVLNKQTTEMEILAPEIAIKALPGEFIILRVDEKGERIPLTIAGRNLKEGTVKIIFQIVGTTTFKLNLLNEGDYISDFVGPLGNPTKLDNLKKVAIIGGGVGCAIALPLAQKLHEEGVIVHAITGFRNKDLVILEDEFSTYSEKLIVTTDDGSYGEKGVVTTQLEKLISEGNKYDEVFAIGPIVMMKYVSLLTKKYNIKTTVSMNPLMIDGTGMCGGCRLKVNNTIKFACVDGPDFDGHEVDFDEAIKRGAVYQKEEKHSYDKACNLFKKEVR